MTYWVTLALMRGLTTRRKNELYSKCFVHTPKISITELFDNPAVWAELNLSPEEQQLFSNAREELSANAFMVEDLINQGYAIIPIDSPDYPPSLKRNLKMVAPSVLFTKGNLSLLQEPAVAVVGSRNAEPVSLQFADNVTHKAILEGKVVVSGFAKGVDREALEATLRHDGKGIIVLPQGITTFNSGFRQYYREIGQGKILVISAFAPNAGWSTGLAMARNPIIYGLAQEIYAAQSDSKGGTWSGVTEGIRNGRKVYVRQPQPGEKNANLLLIDKGAVPVDINGEILPRIVETSLFDMVSEPRPEYKTSPVQSNPSSPTLPLDLE